MLNMGQTWSETAAQSVFNRLTQKRHSTRNQTVMSFANQKFEEGEEPRSQNRSRLTLKQQANSALKPLSTKNRHFLGAVGVQKNQVLQARAAQNLFASLAVETPTTTNAKRAQRAGYKQEVHITKSMLPAHAEGVTTTGQNSRTMVKHPTADRRKPLNAETIGDRSVGSESLTHGSPLHALIANGGGHNLPVISGTIHIVNGSNGIEWN